MLREPGQPSGARNAEVGDLEDVVLTNQEIRRLDVPVDEAGVVRMLQSCARLERKRHNFRVRQLSPLRECVAGDVFHDDVGASFRLAGVVHLDDVRMREPARELRLMQKARPKVSVTRDVLGEHLDRDETVQLFVVREIDDRHAAPAERPLDAIAACREKRLGQSPSPCFLFLPLPLCLPRSCLFSTGTHLMRETRSPTVEPSCSWNAPGIRPALIAASVSL